MGYSIIKDAVGWWVAIAVFAMAMIPGVAQQGMFLDGVTYAAIARNLANGFGSFWELHYTHTLYSAFHEHPPLVFGIQSMFFKLPLQLPTTRFSTLDFLLIGR